jgi:predicted transglutaminase-like cysteine proteinase
LAGTSFAASAWDGAAMLRAAQANGTQAVAGAHALQAVLLTVAAQDDAARLMAINQFFNSRIVFTSDIQVWGVEDYWASPLEMLGKGRGDCEDYVIGKYFGLIAAGTPPARLRLVYVRATLGHPGRAAGAVLPHMVLAYSDARGDDPLILDNLIDDIRPASQRPDLAPVFSFNREGLWQGVAGRRVGDPLARLSRWREVLAKAHAEGFQ